MMTPEDVLIEAIAAASQYGDTPGLRQLECRKLKASLEVYGVHYAADNRTLNSDEDAESA